MENGKNVFRNLSKIVPFIIFIFAFSSCTYTSERNTILNYQAPFTQRVFLENDPDIPEYIQVLFLPNKEKITFKITLWGLEPFVSDHNFVYSLIDVDNPYFKDYKIKYEKKFDEKDWKNYIFGWERFCEVFTEEFYLIFEEGLSPQLESITLLIDGKYRTNFDKNNPIYNLLHKEVKFKLK